MPYQPLQIEKKWQNRWEKETWFQAETGSSKPKYYLLDMFPYPSSEGLHVGHPEGYTATDILARYKRAQGFNVLHPMGWDAFGLPAEQYAIKTGIHPAVTTRRAIDNFKRQIRALGFSYDWSREISTCDPSYYGWTQHLFLKLYERGLAYQKEVLVNWCPALRTVLANEEVENGLSERGQHPVYRVPMKQWMLKITAYAERLLEGLKSLDWPESTKERQRHWIGRSEGVEVSFLSESSSEQSPKILKVFTTRVDTLWGVTFLVLAPEYSGLQDWIHPSQKQAVEAYVQEASRQSEVARQAAAGQTKTGVFTGNWVKHPLTQERLPIWVADYVLASYGTGAVMGVPAHDARDAAFAQTHQLPIRQVLSDDETQIIQSDWASGLSPKEAREEITAWLEARQQGQRQIHYKLRDWLFSRQRYWGEPFPLVYTEDGLPIALSAEALPVVLPDLQNYEPSETGKSPLASFEEWLWTTHPKTGQRVKRETDTMPGSAASSWYFLRFCDPQATQVPFSFEAQRYWMPVDLYLGGPEHAVGHLLYARFWNLVFYDLGLVSVAEPFQKLVHQGMILGADHEKMSKSRGNVVNPDQVIAQYGADTLRLYEMFMGPLSQDKPWSTSAIEGIFRFLNRVWRLFLHEEKGFQGSSETPTEEEQRLLHRTIRKVTEDIEALQFNTAISQLMVWVNEMTHSAKKPRQCLRPFVQLLHPFAPHLAEELWEAMGEHSVLSFEPWPTWDPAWTQVDRVKMAVQISGKTRAVLEVEKIWSQTEVEQHAKKLPTIATHLASQEIRKVIFVPEKILNFVCQPRRLA